MALLEKTLGGIVVGFAAGFFGKSLLSSAGSAVRPIVKSLIAGGLGASDQVKAAAAEAMEQVKDLVAEVQSENGTARHGAASSAKAKQADAG